MTVQYVQAGEHILLGDDGSDVLICLIPNVTAIQWADALIDRYLNSADNRPFDFNHHLHSLHQQIGTYIDPHAVEINDYLVELEWIVEEPLKDEVPYIQAQISTLAWLIFGRSYCEAFVRNETARFLDPREIIRTDEHWLNAEVNMAESRNKWLEVQPLSELPIITIQGIGASKFNESTLITDPDYWSKVVNGSFL